jgi:tripartite-type tricarboxylate transporter receptor subunit TctC
MNPTSSPILQTGLARVMSAGLLVASLALGASASAQEVWPARPVRVIVTFTSGGSADLTARLVGERLTELWKQQVVVENRIGAGGNIGVEAVYRSPADGYTLLLASTAQPINVALYPKLPFDLFRDFVPIALATSTPIALAVHPRVKADTLREYTELLRAQPGKLSYATCGVATSQHFAFEIYKFQAKVDALHVPYRGCAPAVVDTVAGQIDAVVSSLNTVLPHQATGKLKILAITSRDRSPTAPDIPTFRESGLSELADYAAGVYYGFMAPAGTPPSVVARIERDVRTVMAMPEVVRKVVGAGMEVGFVSGEAMGALMRSDAEKMKRIVVAAGIKPE